MADAWSRNHAEEATLLRCQCLAHGRRKCTEIAAAFPTERAVVVNALALVYEPDAEVRRHQLSAAQRLRDHQPYSAPGFPTRKTWLEQQRAERFVEPNSRVGKAMAYRLDHGETLTQGGKEPGAPLDNNVAERALRLGIRQRTNALFSAAEHSAYIASILPRGIATCVQAGVQAVEYLVAVPDHRHEVFAHPRAWLPWTYQAALVPS
jgi:transposase